VDSSVEAKPSEADLEAATSAGTDRVSTPRNLLVRQRDPVHAQAYALSSDAGQGDELERAKHEQEASHS
jgi:hypothetical protein